MLVEGIILSVLAGGIIAQLESSYNYNDKKIESKEQMEIMTLCNKWKDVLLNSNVTGIVNKSGDTFELHYVKITKYGFKGQIKPPNGCNFSALKSAIDTLETNFNGIMEIKKDRYDEYILVDVVTAKPMFKYNGIKVKKYDEMFIGYKPNGQPYIISLKDDPMILISGMTGTGKSFLLASILTNLSYNWGKNVEFHMCQIKKGDISYFRNLKGTKFTSFTLKEVAQQLEKLDKLTDERTKKLDKAGDIRDIEQWNEFFPKQKMKRIFVILEELSFFMPSENAKDDDEENAYKKIIWDKLWSIVKTSRFVGISFIGLTQRTTIKNLPSEVKSQMSSITFKQKSVIDSQNVINTNDAVGLQKKYREFIFDGTEYIKLVAPTIDRQFEVLHEYVPEIIVPKNPIQHQEEDVLSKNERLIEETNKLREKSEIIQMDCTMDEYIARLKYTPKTNPSNKIKPKGSGKR